MWTRETKVTNPEGTEVAWASPKGACKPLPTLTGSPDARIEIMSETDLDVVSYGLAMEFIDISTGQKRLLGVKGDWKRNATLVVDDEVVAAVEKHSVLRSGVRTLPILTLLEYETGGGRV
jgi:hypothetical protein